MLFVDSDFWFSQFELYLLFQFFLTGKVFWFCFPIGKFLCFKVSLWTKRVPFCVMVSSVMGLVQFLTKPLFGRTILWIFCKWLENGDYVQTKRVKLDWFEVQLPDSVLFTTFLLHLREKVSKLSVSSSIFCNLRILTVLLAIGAGLQAIFFAKNAFGDVFSSWNLSKMSLTSHCEKFWSQQYITDAREIFTPNFFYRVTFWVV